jgi:hypothetical protein
MESISPENTIVKKIFNLLDNGDFKNVDKILIEEVREEKESALDTVRKIRDKLLEMWNNEDSDGPLHNFVLAG